MSRRTLLFVAQQGATAPYRPQHGVVHHACAEPGRGLRGSRHGLLKQTDVWRSREGRDCLEPRQCVSLVGSVLREGEPEGPEPGTRAGGGHRPGAQGGSLAAPVREAAREAPPPTRLPQACAGSGNAPDSQTTAGPDPHARDGHHAEDGARGDDGHGEAPTPSGG
jgi:hypothetical protein